MSRPTSITARTVSFSNSPSSAAPRASTLETPRPGLKRQETYTALGDALWTHSGISHTRGQGQGPFKNSNSVHHALSGVLKVAEEIKLALGRMDPNQADLDGIRRGNDRALLGGLDVLIAAAIDAEANATKHLKQLKSGGTPAVGGPTPKHRDPRLGLKEQLSSTAKLARTVLSDLTRHQKALQWHVDNLKLRLKDLDIVYQILARAVDDSANKTLTRTTSPPKSPRGTFKDFKAAGGPSAAAVAAAASFGTRSAPSTPRGGIHARSTTATPTAAAPEPSGIGGAILGALGLSPKPDPAAAATPTVDVSDPTSSSPPKSPRSGPAFSARVAVAGSGTAAPWSPEEDFVLIELIKLHGLSRWAVIAESLPDALAKKSTESKPPRTSGLCKERWETMLNAYLSVKSSVKVCRGRPTSCWRQGRRRVMRRLP